MSHTVIGVLAYLCMSFILVLVAIASPGGINTDNNNPLGYNTAGEVNYSFDGVDGLNPMVTRCTDGT